MNKVINISPNVKVVDKGTILNGVVLSKTPNQSSVQNIIPSTKVELKTPIVGSIEDIKPF